MLFVWAGALRAIRHRPSEGGESHSWWCLGGLLGFHALSAFCLGAFLFTVEEMETIANLEAGGAQFLEGDTYEILPDADLEQTSCASSAASVTAAAPPFVAEKVAP